MNGCERCISYDGWWENAGGGYQGEHFQRCTRQDRDEKLWPEDSDDDCPYFADADDDKYVHDPRV
ncbi:MAG: hypothetical protein GWP08_20300 [Nitrospiraceae bacterium]|nr:hypothetical protein [Nitrospiraceae bacterium]